MEGGGGGGRGGEGWRGGRRRGAGGCGRGGEGGAAREAEIWDSSTPAAVARDQPTLGVISGTLELRRKVRRRLRGRHDDGGDIVMKSETGLMAAGCDRGGVKWPGGWLSSMEVAASEEARVGGEGGGSEQGGDGERGNL